MATVFGGVGVGKTLSILLPTLANIDKISRSGAPLTTTLCLDISGDIISNLKTPNMIVIAPDGCGDIPTSQYDVFAAVDSASDSEKYTALKNLAFACIPTVSSGVESNSKYYQDSGRKYLLGCLLYGYDMNWDFPEICRKIFFSLAEDLIGDIKKSGNENARGLVEELLKIAPQQLGGIAEVAKDAIEIFVTTPNVASTIKRGGVSPATLEKQSVYLYIPEKNLIVYSKFLRIVLSQAVHFGTTRGNYKNPKILIAIDEAARIGRIENLVDAMRTLRKKHFRFLLLTQSKQDLDAVYGADESKILLGLCRLKAVLSADDVDTQKYFSDLAGEHLVKRETITEDADGKPGRVSYTYHREKRIQPEEFGLLDNHLYLFHKHGVIKIRKNSFFTKLYDPRTW
jgi:type IV secretory pathway TraG/TraD family ATPase VirD4